MSPRSRAPLSWDEYAVEIGRRLEAQRRAAGLTQEALAHAAGITRTHYQQLERGSWGQGKPSNPSVKVLVRVSQVLNTGLADLLPDAERVRW